MRWPKSSAPSRGNTRWPWLGSVGVACGRATAQPSRREVVRSPWWDVKKSKDAVLSTPRSSSMPKAGVQTVTAQSRCARASGSPWGCSPPSSLPLCGSVMTYISSKETHYRGDNSYETDMARPFRISHRGGRGQDLIDPFLSDNPSRDNGWSGYLTGKNSTQGGDR